MVLHPQGCGRVGHCREYFQPARLRPRGLFLFRLPLTVRRNDFYPDPRTEPLSQSTHPSSWRHRSVVPVLFVLPFVALIVQCVLIVTRIGEPYPAIMMPGFVGTQTSAEGAIGVQAIEIEVRFVGSSAIERPRLATLLAPMPIGMLMPASAYMFHSHPTGTSPLRPRSGLKDWLVDTVLPLRGRRYRRALAGNPPAPDTVQWIGRRLESLYPRRPVQSVTFNWYRDFYRLQEGRPERIEHQQFDSYRIAIAQ